ncbi:MAG: RNA polymerase factor sigma-54, partial [Thiomicrorhabdus sp.]|nr:RNA polymerase factor sigma-54 [Thiomicrorhabdus sp.]
MALMPGLQINIGQQLKLTPQLQQSIKILQYSALEVQQTIEATLEVNYLLELEEDQLSENDNESLDALAEKEEKTASQENTNTEEQPVDINNNSEALSNDLEIDCNWDEVYSDHTSISSSQSAEDYVGAENYTASEKTLHDHLFWQSDIYPWDQGQEVLASYIIDDINEEGYLASDLDALLSSINQNESPETPYTLEKILEVLAVIQQFEPTGVGAQSIQETLLLQLKALPNNPFVVTAKQLVSEHFDWLSFHDHKRIKKFYSLNDEELITLLKLIQSLNPRPGRNFSSTQSEIIIPDLKIKRAKQGWLVELNPNAFPRLTINSAYVDLTKSLNNSEQSKKIKEQLIEAKGLIKSIHSRGETLLRVGR